MYSYTAYSPSGTRESGQIAADGHAAARAMLTARGLYPLELRELHGHERARGTLPITDLALGLRILADLLDAGLPLTRALQAFEELAPATWRALLPHLLAVVKEGQSLAGALATAPVLIPPLVIGIAQSGEATGSVAAAIRRAADVTESAAATRAAFRSALAYPLLLALAGTASIGVLVGVVLPRFAAILADIGQALPPATRMVMATAVFAQRAFLPALGAGIVMAVSWKVWTSRPAGIVQWHGALLEVPGLGRVRRAAAVARCATSLAALLESGVPMAAALRHAARASGDAALESRLLTARERVVAGASLAQALQATDAATPIALRLVRAGEETGRLPHMLQHAGRLEQEWSERVVRTAVRLLEPALILIFAAIVAIVAAALLQAVYSVRPTA